MKSILFLLYFMIAPALILNSCISCEQLSTVFVLETSDSSNNNNENYSVPAPAIVIKPKSQSQPAKQQIEDQNTRIITDDTPPNSPSSTRKPQQINHHSTSGPVNDHKQNEHSNQHQLAHKSEEKQQQVPTTRRIEEETQPNHQRVATRNVNHQSTNTHHKQRITTSTTEAPYVTTPKTEERLLISITSNDDEEDNSYKPPPKQQVSSGITNQGEEFQPQQQQQLSHHKRKPSITISIQDANLKQNGVVSNQPAVILRPSENGQSIVISTLETNSGNSGNKYVGQNSKPAIAIVSSASEAPYREPVLGNNNNHQQDNNNLHQSHYTSTSTRRPILVNDYNPVASNVQSNRPIVSTLIDPQRPPNQGVEERPQRPVVVQPTEDTIYEQQRPTSRPVNKPVQDPTGYNQNGNNEQSEYNSLPTRPNSQQQQQQQEQAPKYPLNEKNCGLVHETRIVGGDEANPDDFLWMAAIIKSKPKDGDVKPFCGGSLITRRHILTAAHCLEGLAPRDVLVRLGSYDFDDSTASSLSADYAIDQFRVPGQYSKKTHVADIAIIRLKTPLATTDNYKTVCMPQARRSYVGILGTVTGYGSQSQTFRRAAPKLRQVTVPIWENRKCSVVYKKNLTESFLCAGWEEGGKDACQGDSGGPLMTEGPNERMMIVGVVSHGIGCGSPGYPGVYTRTTTYLDWIEKNTKE